jgi:hypothetical protein
MKLYQTVRMGEEVQTLRESAFMLHYTYTACLIKTENRKTEQILSTSVSATSCQVTSLHETDKNTVGFDGSSPFKHTVHRAFTLLIASSQESNLRHPREREILSLSSLNVTAAPR